MKRLVLVFIAMYCVAFAQAACSYPVVANPSGPAAKPRGDWVTLGKRTVRDRTDRDEIRVKKGKGTFSRLRIEVIGSAVELRDLVITFDNGERYSPHPALAFRGGTQNRVFDLPAPKRVIQRIKVRYENLARNGMARVTFYAR